MIFRSASRARMKRSTGCCTPAISGILGTISGFSDHQSASVGRFFIITRGSGAPRFTHSSSSAISADGRFSFGGIWCSSSLQRTILMSRLSSGLPTTIAGPESPPCSQPLFESSVRPPFIFFSCEWHSKQRCFKSGSIFDMKNSSAKTLERPARHPNSKNTCFMLPASFRSHARLSSPRPPLWENAPSACVRPPRRPR